MNRITRIVLYGLVLASCGSPERQEPVPAAETEIGEPPPVVADGDTSSVSPVGDGGRRLVYIPVYSHIYYGDRRRSINLAATLSVRNTDPERPITVTSVRYYDTAGKLVRHYLEQPVRLAPMASLDFVIDERDESGGSGANFLVEWSARQPVTEPIFEAVMISTRQALGISFTSEGRTLERQ